MNAWQQLVRKKTPSPGVVEACWCAWYLVDSGCLALDGQMVDSEVTFGGQGGMCMGERTVPHCSPQHLHCALHGADA